METENSLINLIDTELKQLDQVKLSEIYTYILKYISSNSRKDLKEIKKEDLLDNYINSKLDISDNTIKNYKSTLSCFLDYLYPNINKDTLMAYLRKNIKWSSNTKNRNYIFIKNFLSYLHKYGYLDENLSEFIKIPKKQKTVKFVPNDSQINLFFLAIKKIFKDEEKLRFLTIFLIYGKTGLRLYELINLNYEDLDFENNRIYLKHTKNGDNDYVSMDDQLRVTLKKYIIRFNIKNGALIIGKGGKRINKNVINDNLKKIVREAGLPKEFTAHTFRRFFIDKNRRAKVDIFLLGELARHKDLNTTRAYLNVSEEEKREAISNIKIAV